MAIATRKTEPFTIRNRQFRVFKEIFCALSEAIHDQKKSSYKMNPHFSAGRKVDPTGGWVQPKCPKLMISIFITRQKCPHGRALTPSLMLFTTAWSDFGRCTK